MSIKSWRIWLIASAGICLLLGSQAQAAPIPVCETNPPGSQADFTCTYTRAVDFWFGTLSVQGVASPSQDFFQATDQFTSTLAGVLQLDGSIDARVKVGVTAFSVVIGSIEWILGTPENLPAQQNLLGDYAAADAALDALFGPGTIALQSVTQSNANYALAETVLFCAAGSIPPECNQGGEDAFLLSNFWRAQVNMFEQNAVWNLDAPGPTPVPEPATMALLGLGIVSLAVSRRRSTPRT